MTSTPRIAFLPGAAGERALVTRMLAGEELAYRECYELHSARVMRVLLRMIGDRGRAEDVLQETFASVFAHIGDFRGESQLGTWITNIAVRRALNHIRDSSRRPALTLHADAAEAMEVPRSEEDLHVRRDLAGHVLRVLGMLEPARRTSLLLHAEGYTAAEISRMMRTPRSTVLSHIARARAALRELLGEHAPAAAVDADDDASGKVGGHE